jgi:periplasmic protein TonB
VSVAPLPGRDPLRASLGWSFALHVLAVAALVLVRPAPPPPMPPVYKVELIAAPAGPRAIGAVDPVREAAAATPPPARAEQKAPSPVPDPTRRAPAPRTATRATTTPPRAAQRTDRAAEQARAGGGDIGGQGTDVANVRIDGVPFPYPSYLTNIVNQIALRFVPPRGSVLSADVAFLIHRDGRVSDIRVVRRSGSVAFDLEAQGAVEAAGRQFGPLPTGFADDVLPIVFSFDPRLIR